jgi:hypothetical protein
MSALTGTYINQTYGGVVHLSTNAAAVPSSNTFLEDGTGQNLGISLNTNGTVTATTFIGSFLGNVTGNVTGNLTGTASFATSASYSRTATSSSYAIQATSSSYALTSSYSTTLGASLSSPANNQVRLLSSNGGTLSTLTVNNVTSASFADNANSAITASYANNANLLDGINSTQFATTASNIFVGNQIITGSVSILGSIINITGSTTFTGSVSQNVYDIPTVPFNYPLYNTCSIDFNSGSYFTYTLATYASPSTHFVVRNLKPGSSATIQVSQDITGFGTATFAPNITFPSGSQYVPFNSASAADVITLISYDGIKVRAVAANNFI